MDYNKELDYVLRRLLELYKKDGIENILNDSFGGTSNEDEVKTTNTRIREELKNYPFNLKHWETKIVFEQLLLDGYIKSIEPLCITLKGAVFISRNGYSQTYRTEIKKLAMERAERKKARHNEKCVRYSMIATALFSGSIVLLEIWKILNQNSSLNSYHFHIF